MILFLKFCFLFSTGTVLGWGIEVLWRRFFGAAKRWLNPGFLNGPWLPIYGFGTVVLYLICSLNLSLPITGLVFLTVLTSLEFIAGLIFKYGFKMKLWDYSDRKGNILGLICPFYSLLWTVLGFGFYFGFYPFLHHRIERLLVHLEFSFFIGIYAGIFILDIVQSFHLATQIKTLLKESNTKLQVDFENYKLEIRDRFKMRGILKGKERRKLNPLFLLPFRGESIQSHREGLKLHIRKIREKASVIIEKQKKEIHSKRNSSHSEKTPEDRVKREN